MVEQKPDIKQRQEEIREILGVIPTRVARWGTTIIGLVLVSLFLGAALFNYPDRIRSTLTITTRNPPVPLIARKDGRLLMMKVTDNQRVEQGDLLGVLESSADYHDMHRLDSLVQYFRSDSGSMDFRGTATVMIPELNLGEWQTTYSGLRKAWQDLVDFNQQESHPARIASLKKQLQDYQLLFDGHHRQTLVHSEELAMRESQFNRIKQLSDSGTLAVTDLEAAKSDLLRARMEVEGARTLLSQTKVEMDRLEYSLLLEEKEFLDLRNQKITNLNQAVSLASGTLADWKLNYALISPVTGKASLTRIWAENQPVKSGERVLMLLPEEPGPLVGKMLLTVKGAGKVKSGQKAIIRLDPYPYMEFGFLTGCVESISTIPEKDYYCVEISFPEGLKTSSLKELGLTQEMTGQAEILTEEISFLIRVINPLKHLLQRNRN